jgi:hypothetical protein
MRISARKMLGVAGVALLCFGLPSRGQNLYSSPAINSVTFTGSETTIFSNQDGSVGAGTYGAVINGTASSSGIICDDYNDEITAGEQWSAHAYQATSLASGNISNTLFGSTVGLTGYAEVATLVSMMFSGGKTYGSITGVTQAELSSAIWDITTAGGIKGLDTNATKLVAAVKTAFSGNTSAATAYLATLTNLWILTPTASEPNRPQEMWVAVPEGGSELMYLLLAGAFCFGAMFFRHRNQPVRSESSDLLS